MKPLRALFGDYPHTRALVRGEVATPDLALDFARVNGRLPFRDFIRAHQYDLGELPLVPLLQLRALGRPFVLLPVVLTARMQHDSFYVRADSGLTPRDLGGCRVGLRSDANTGVAWSLGILQNDYGVDVSSFRVVAVEDNHVAEYVSPPRVAIGPPGTDLAQMLADGEIDMLVTETDLSGDERFRHLIADPAAEAQRWVARHGFRPAGHVVALNADVSSANPGLARALFELLRRSQAASGAPAPERAFGADAMRPVLELAMDFAVQQQLVSRRLDLDDLYDDATRALRA